MQLFKSKTTVFLASCIRIHSAIGQEGEVHIYIAVCLNILVSSVLVFCIILPLADGVTVHSVTPSANKRVCVCVHIYLL